MAEADAKSGAIVAQGLPTARVAQARAIEEVHLDDLLNLVVE